MEQSDPFFFFCFYVRNIMCQLGRYVLHNIEERLEEPERSLTIFDFQNRINDGVSLYTKYFANVCTIILCTHRLPSDMTTTEIPIWVAGKQLWVSGVDRKTTVSDVVETLLGHPDKQYSIMEKWRRVERPLNADTRILKLWKTWGDAKTEVKLSLKKVPATMENDSGKWARPVLFIFLFYNKINSLFSRIFPLCSFEIRPNVHLASLQYSTLGKRIFVGTDVIRFQRTILQQYSLIRRVPFSSPFFF